MDLDLDFLKERLKKQIRRRDKEIHYNGYASSKITKQISKTRMMIKLAEKTEQPEPSNKETT